jgi:hypothetical protein
MLGMSGMAGIARMFDVESHGMCCDESGFAD